MLTPQKIQDLSDPIESVYISMTNELLVNIGKHITSPTWTHTAAWEIQKLSELGQLTRENAAIINSWIAQLPEEIRATMEETRHFPA
jgi:Mlc titration factor MtfA (ptsG expression regulator)